MKGKLAILCAALCCLQVNAKDSSLSSMELHSDSRASAKHINNTTDGISASNDTVTMLLDEMRMDTMIVHVPFIRSLRYIEAQRPVCIINRIKTPEREQKYLFSSPLNFFETQRLYQIEELPPISAIHLNAEGEINSLHRVINAMPSSTIMLPKHFSFGQRVDEDLAKVNKSQVIRISNADYYDSFIRMWAAKRTEFAIIFPVELYKHFKQDMPIKMRSYGIANNPKFVSGHIMCGDNAQGKAFINKVNQAIHSLYKKKEFVEAHTRYLPQDSVEPIASIIQQHTETLSSRQLE